MSPRIILTLAGALGFLSVVLGAFGAHALKSRLSPEMLAIFETGVRYQMYHALAMLGTGILALQLPAGGWGKSAMCFFIGSVIFSGSLYILVASGVKIWGAVTPVGGVFMLIGWILFLLSAWKSAV